MRIIHLITGLGQGGAEAMLLKLLGATDRAKFDPVVVTLMSAGALKESFRQLDVPVHEVGMPRGAVTPGGILRLRTLARELAPRTIQGWMYHGNLAAVLMARFAAEKPDLLWNIRHSVHDLGMEKPLTRLVIRLGARVSDRPRRIIFNSSTSALQHAGLGYPRDKSVVIPNGFDLDLFQPDPRAGARLRGELGLGSETPLVGWVGRMHPHKAPLDFLEAAKRVVAQSPQTRFVLAGSGMTGMDPGLRRFLDVNKLKDRVHLLGPRSDIPGLMGGLDVLCLSSVTEAFPNVLGEALACGVPCVATDVGDAARIIGTAGRITPPSDPAALAGGLLELLALPPAARRDLGLQGRERIRKHYSLAAVTAAYEDLYTSS